MLLWQDLFPEEMEAFLQRAGEGLNYTWKTRVDPGVTSVGEDQVKPEDGVCGMVHKGVFDCQTS